MLYIRSGHKEVSEKYLHFTDYLLLFIPRYYVLGTTYNKYRYLHR